MSASRPTRHLDLGCGAKPRNPLNQAELFGVDLMPPQLPGMSHIVAANLALQPIPFAADQFDSVSAFDFLEHVPRILATADGQATRFPFIELMDEIFRVLRPGGTFYALTPAYPAPEAFQDPTHVNIITDRTHQYFCGDAPLGRMYGFRGSFRAQRVDWVRSRDAYVAQPDLKKDAIWKIKQWNYRRRGEVTHLLWNLECMK